MPPMSTYLEFISLFRLGRKMTSTHFTGSPYEPGAGRTERLA
ncbi:hypothetical protein FHW37_12217 [Neorhizobium alkalisoli]|uniref:Uncharacterized protein n=1 Tax=Neorhizobium alkalisoli TaxID=528178 RepID=A0A561PYZ3_9HYPH|nr:hypothetical protein FHW37_12217 [Neorhizobium alkalisoli]